MLRRILNTVNSETTDLESIRLNTINAALMECSNGLSRAREGGVEPAVWEEAIDTLLLLVAPSAPHMAEELWARRGRPYSIHNQSWPAYDPSLAADEAVTVAVQVNGKLRDRVPVPADADQASVRRAAFPS